MGAVDRNDILRLDPAIMVLVEGQERFVHRGEVTRYLEAYLAVELLDPLLNLLDVLLLLRLGLWWVRSRTVHNWVVAGECHVREEQPTELCVSETTLAIFENVLHVEEAGDFFGRQLRPSCHVAVEEQV